MDAPGQRVMARAAAVAALAALVVGCAGPAQLRPGVSDRAEVDRIMGVPPAIDWRGDDGSVHLLYPTGPMGYHTWRVDLDPAGRVAHAENVLDEAHFAALQPGMSTDEVLRALGPPRPSGTAYFAARRELAWEWRYCDAWNSAARFNVLFDADRGTVRSTLSVREECHQGRCICSR